MREGEISSRWWENLVQKEGISCQEGAKILPRGRGENLDKGRGKPIIIGYQLS